MTMQLSNLIVMQSDLRNWKIEPLISHVKNGGFWTEDFLTEYSKKNNLTRVSPKIAISRFEDGLLFLHDGHHRCAATWLGGRDYLRDDEYSIVDWKYSEYLEIAPENNWFTPFDPRIHVRTADFSKFKREAKEKFEKDFESAKIWLFQHFDDFRAERNIKYVPELAAIVIEVNKK